MPELPEVEATRSFANLHCKGKTVKEAVVQEDTSALSVFMYTGWFLEASWSQLSFLCLPRPELCGNCYRGLPRQAARRNSGLSGGQQNNRRRKKRKTFLVCPEFQVVMYWAPDTEQLFCHKPSCTQAWAVVSLTACTSLSKPFSMKRSLFPTAVHISSLPAAATPPTETYARKGECHGLLQVCVGWRQVFVLTFGHGRLLANRRAICSKVSCIPVSPSHTVCGALQRHAPHEGRTTRI